MRTYGSFREARLSQVTPSGWLRTMLEKERDGFAGHLDEIGYPYNLPCWQLKTMADGGFEQWWPYEQTGYWMDSMTRTAYLLRDEKMIQKFRGIIDTSIENAVSGFIGPDDLQNGADVSHWPHAVYFRAIYALWSATGDEKYLKAMERHYFLPDTHYDNNRDAVNVESMLRVAQQLDSGELRDFARKNYLSLQEKSAETEDYGWKKMLTETPTGIHGVTLNEIGKLPALYYLYFGDAEHLKAVVHLYEKILRDHMLPDGVHSSHEWTAGNDSLQCHESCDISDFTWSVGYLLEATGEAKYGDLIERAIFNAAPGVIAPDFSGIQYFSSVNQVRATRNACHADAFQNTTRMAYQPHHYPECCVGNIGRAFPNYVARMYWETEDGIACVLYGDSEFTGKGITLKQTGGYPFHDTVTFTVSCEGETGLSLRFRLPGWCKAPVLSVNGEKAEYETEKGFAVIRRIWKTGDTVTLQLPMEFASHVTDEGGVYFDYGPILLSLRIRENWAKDEEEPRQTAAFPAFAVEPESPWSYAVTGAETPRITFHEVGENPWWNEKPWLEAVIPARILTNWTTVKKSSVAKHGEQGIDAKQIMLGAVEVREDLEQMPPLPTAEEIAAGLGETEEITLIPFGSSHLRVTVFPRANAE